MLDIEQFCLLELVQQSSTLCAGAEIVRLINARKKELLEGSEKKLSFHKDRLHESEDSDEILTDDDSDDKSHAINIQIASELHGGRSAEW